MFRLSFIASAILLISGASYAHPFKSADKKTCMSVEQGKLYEGSAIVMSGSCESDSENFIFENGNFILAKHPEMCVALTSPEASLLPQKNSGLIGAINTEGTSHQETEMSSTGVSMGTSSSSMNTAQSMNASVGTASSPQGYTRPKPALADFRLKLANCNEEQDQKFVLDGTKIAYFGDQSLCINQNGTSPLSLAACDPENKKVTQQFYIPKVCLYDDNHYQGGQECFDKNTGMLAHNDRASAVSLVNSTVALFEHGSYQGRKLTVTTNAPVLSEYNPEKAFFNDIASSAELDAIQTFIITSDPQYLCTTNCSVSEQESKKNIDDLYHYINKNYADANAVFINGDLTEFGHLSEVDEMNKYLKKLHVPYYYGLGNHDYINNLDDCYQNTCTIRSVMRFIDHVRSLKNLNSFDGYYVFGYQFPRIVREVSGSLSYSANFGNSVYIQLHDNPFFNSDHPKAGYPAGVSEDGGIRLSNYVAFDKDLWGSAYKININPNNAYLWLENELIKARQQGKTVIIGKHRHDSSTRLNALLDKYDVQLRFSGHYHNDYGYGSGNGSRRYNLTGSTARGNFTVLTLDNKKHIATSETFDKNRKRIDYHEYTLPEGMKVEDPVTPARLVRIKNKGGYVANTTVTYTDNNGKSQTWSSGNLAMGNSKSTYVPAGSKNISIVAKTKTGKTIFSHSSVQRDSCIDVYGTVIKPKWTFMNCM